MKTIKSIFEFLLYLSCIFSLMFVVGFLTHKFAKYDEIVRTSIVAVIIFSVLLVSFIKQND